VKNANKLLWVVLCVQFFVLAVIILLSRVNDMTLSKGEIVSFNDGWVMVREDGYRSSLKEIPYHDSSQPGEVVKIQNTVPEKYWGRTLSFLSADKVLRITVDGEEVYSFGTQDYRPFGHTPGSVMVFADIPSHCQKGIIEIEMTSSYADYATYVTEMILAKRDVAILYFLKQKAPDLLCDFVIFLVGGIFLILTVIQRMTQNSTEGIEKMAIYLLFFGVYYLIETKVLVLFYGNQTLYSNLVFIILMTAPLFFESYYCQLRENLKKPMGILMCLSYANIGCQLVLQLTNTVDFLTMAFLSHGLIFLNIMVVFVTYCRLVRKERTMAVYSHLVGILFMGAGAVLDVTRSYIEKVGDFGKYSRYGMAVYAVCILIYYIQLMVREQVEFAEKAKNDAISANLAKSRFLANMSHEIRTPINGILGMDAVLLKECRDEELRGYAKNIQSAGNSLLSIINDILDISKIESGKMEIIPVEYELFSVLNDCYNMTISRAKEKSLDLCMEIEQDLPSLLYGDEVRVRQVINNFLSNAVKYTQEGKIVLKMTWEKNTRDSITLVISVKDSGIGIKQQDLKKLFQSFTRLEEQRNRNIEGTGLGLNLTKYLVDLMGGELSVESVYGKGSCFTARIPQKVLDDAPLGDFQERYQSNLSDRNERQLQILAPEAKILVVDDVSMNLKVMEGLLKETKIQIFMAVSGAQCLNMVSVQHFDMIFLDHMMPEMDGIETLEQMKQMPDSPNRDTPVIALTANAVFGAKDIYMKAGFDDYLTKPVRESELLAMIKQYLPWDLVQMPQQKPLEVSAKEKQGREPFEEKDTRSFMERLTFLDREKGLEYCCNDETFYREMLLVYVGESKEKALQEMYQEENWKEYQVLAHAVKSTSLSIGAVTLSENAKELEMAAQDENISYITRHHEEVIEEYTSLLNRIKKALED
jgi:signal transduction histidine kinase/DNA-binding response OmpR family regulator